MKIETVTTAADVTELYSSLNNLGIQIWIDGGWGVDALLGRQTRPHKDLDIAVQEKDLPILRSFLEARGYKDVKSEDTKPWNFVLGDDNNHEIDIHVIVLDENGNGIYGPIENGEMYPASSLTGQGIINGETVKCISAEWMIKFHSGYELKNKDFRDVSALCEKFGIALPEEYTRFKIDLNLLKEFINQCNLAEIEPIQLVRESSDNFVYSIGEKSKRILRISKRLPTEDVKFEFEVSNYLSQHNFPVPKWNKTKAGEIFALADGKIGVIFDFVDGYHVKVDKDNLPSRVQAETAGIYLAQFHNLGLDFKSDSPRKRNIFSEFERTLDKKDLLRSKFDGGKEFIKQVEEAVKFGHENMPTYGLIHGDLRPDNVFFKSDSEISGFIDFDWSCIGPQIKDLALAVVEWSFPDRKTKPDWELFDSFLEGYNSVAKTKYEKGVLLYSWIKFTTLSDTSTYFCDLANDPSTKKTLNSYMYQKYLFFTEL